MRHTWRTSLLAGAVIAAAVGTAQAQPANCRDINNDGSVTATDGSVLENRLVNPSAVVCGGPTSANIDCADLNNNGSIDPGDRVLLAQTLAGVETLFPACTGAPAATCPASFSGNITSNTTWGPAGCVVNISRRGAGRGPCRADRPARHGGARREEPREPCGARRHPWRQARCQRDRRRSHRLHQQPGARCSRQGRLGRGDVERLRSGELHGRRGQLRRPAPGLGSTAAPTRTTTGPRAASPASSSPASSSARTTS